jgi:hypothetical protein
MTSSRAFCISCVDRTVGRNAIAIKAPVFNTGKEYFLLRLESPLLHCVLRMLMIFLQRCWAIADLNHTDDLIQVQITKYEFI